MKRARLLLVALLVAASFAGCKSGPKDDPILRLAAAESLAEGKKLLEQGKHARARRYLSHAFEVEPNSASGREALLLVADTFYLEGGSSNFIQAEAKYRDFLNRFPTSDQAAYAQFQIANSLAKRMEKPDRDQSSTQKALEAYEELKRLYPTSEYAEEAEEKIALVRQNLAEHEFLVGQFNYRYGNILGAVQRFEELLENFPDYAELDKAIYHLGLSYSRSPRLEDRAKARATFDRLRAEHPESPYVSEIPPKVAVPEAVPEEVSG